MYFVEIAAGFSDVGENTANGLAFVGANGITQHVGDNLVSFLGGQELIAKVVSHEIGHNLGLFHFEDVPNLMQANGATGEARLIAAQIATARASQFVVAVPEPTSLALVVCVVACVVLSRRRFVKPRLIGGIC